MNFVELIGFVITMIALMMLSYRQSKEAQKRKNDDVEEYSPERLKQDPAVQQLLRTMNIEPEKKKREVVREQPKHIPLKAKINHAVDDAYKLPSQHLAIKGDLLKKVTLKEAMILHTILGPPKGE